MDSVFSCRHSIPPRVRRSLTRRSRNQTGSKPKVRFSPKCLRTRINRGLYEPPKNILPETDRIQVCRYSRSRLVGRLAPRAELLLQLLEMFQSVLANQRILRGVVDLCPQEEGDLRRAAFQ